MFGVSNVSFYILPKKMFLLYIYIYVNTLVSESQTHNEPQKHEPRAQGPKTEIRKRKNREKGKKKKFLSAIQNRGKRSERRSRESESLRDLPAARRRRRRSSCRGSLCDGNVRAESRLFIHSKSTTQCLQI